MRTSRANPRVAAHISGGDRRGTHLEAPSSRGPSSDHPPPDLGWQGHFLPLGGPFALGGENLSTTVFETGRSARIDGYDDASGPVGLAVREGGVRSAVGAPIVVEGRLWGALTVASTEEPLPASTEARLASFTELVATAIANIDVDQPPLRPVRIRDDGVGGARPEGSGIVGLADRLTALGGELQLHSPAEGGTLVAAAIPGVPARGS